MTAAGIDLVHEYGARRPVAEPARSRSSSRCPVPGPSTRNCSPPIEGIDGVRGAVAEPGPATALWAARETHTESIARSTTTPVGETRCRYRSGHYPRPSTDSPVVPADLGVQGRPILFGHVGDGNIHVNYLDVPCADEHRVTEAVFAVVADLGSISAEHGIGRAKAAWIGLDGPAPTSTSLRCAPSKPPSTHRTCSTPASSSADQDGIEVSSRPTRVPPTGATVDRMTRRADSCDDSRVNTVDRARLVELAGRLGVADSYVGWDKLDHGGHRHPDQSSCRAGRRHRMPGWVDAALDDADADGWRAFLPAVTVSPSKVPDTGSTCMCCHGDPVSVWITTEDGESVPAAQAEHWVDPREVDGVLTGRATFIVPAGLGVGYHTLHAQNPPATRPLRRR